MIWTFQGREDVPRDVTSLSNMDFPPSGLTPACKHFLPVSYFATPSAPPTLPLSRRFSHSLVKSFRA